MARYEIAVRTPAAAAAAAYAQLITTSSKPVYVLEIGAYVTAGTSSSIGLGRPATAGTASTTATVQALKSGDATGVSTMATAWSAAPTAPTNFFRRFTSAATIGSGFVWQWPPGTLLVPVSSTLVLWNFGAGAGAALDAYIVVDE